MNDVPRSLIIVAGGSVAMMVVTLGLAWTIVGPTPVAEPQGTGPPSAPPPVAASGIGGALTITGDRTGTLVLDREVIGESYAVAGNDGRVEFAGQPTGMARLQFDGLSFFLDPDECAVTPGERDAETGLVPVDVSCVAISDVREQGVFTVDGTLRLSADQFGLRGDLPQTGGEVAVGGETLVFDVATIDLQRPEVIVDADTRVTTRNPVWYPVTLDGAGGSLRFEYDYRESELTLTGVELAGDLIGRPEATCGPSFRVLGELSPQVTVAEMTVDCPAVVFEGRGSMPVTGTLTVDVIEFPG